MDDLIRRWSELSLKADAYGRSLEEAQDILELNTHLDKVDAWIREKASGIAALRSYERAYRIAYDYFTVTDCIFFTMHLSLTLTNFLVTE